jgi:PAS domain S-box-containing protein
MRVLLLAPASTDHVALRAALGAAVGAATVDILHTAESAVTWIENRPCDLVGIAGAGSTVVEAVERLRRASRTLPLLALVDDLASRDAGAAWLAGADDVLPLGGLAGGTAPEGLEELRRQDRDALRRTQRVWYAGAHDGLRQQLTARLGPRMRDVGLSGEGLAGLTTQDVETPHAAVLVVNALAEPAAFVLGVRRVKRTYPALAITVVADSAHHDAFRRAGADECLGPAPDVDHLLHAVGRAQATCRGAAELDAVRAREMRLRALLENLPEAVVLVSPEHTTLAVNLAALRLLGAQDARQVLGSALAPWLESDGEDASAVDTLVDAVRGGSTREAVLRTRHLADPRRIHMRAVPFQREAGGPPAALIVLRDVTTLAQAAPAATDVEAHDTFEAARRAWDDERAATASRLQLLEGELAEARREAERVATLEAAVAEAQEDAAALESVRMELDASRSELERLLPIEADLRTAAARIGELEAALEISRDEAMQGSAARAELEVARASAHHALGLETELDAARARLAETAAALDQAQHAALRIAGLEASLEDARAVAARVGPLEHALREAHADAADVVRLRERVQVLERLEAEELPALHTLVEQLRARDASAGAASALDQLQQRLAQAGDRIHDLEGAVASLERDRLTLEERLRARLEPEPTPAARESVMTAGTLPAEHHWLLEHVARVGVVVTDDDGRIVEANERAARLCGFESVAALRAAGVLPAPLAAVAGEDHSTASRFELCLQLAPDAMPLWINGARLPVADGETSITWWLAESPDRAATHPLRARPETMSAVLEVATAECAALVASVSARPRGPRPIDVARDSDPAADRRALGRAQVMLAQLSTLGRRRAAPCALDLSAQLNDMAPVLQRLAGDDVRWHFEPPAEPVHACVTASDLERWMTGLVSAARDALPLGGQLSLIVDASVPASLSTENGIVRADVRCLIEVQGYGMTVVDVPASARELARDLGATLEVEAIDALTSTVALRLPRAFVVARAA